MGSKLGRLSATVAGMVLAVPLVLAASGTHSFAGTSTTTFAPAADSFVDKSNPNANFGTRSVLRIDASPVIRSYLRYAVSGVGAPVTKATLQVYAQDSSTAGFTVTVTCTGSSHSVPAVTAGLGPTSSQAYYVVDITATAGVYGGPDYVSRHLQTKILGPVTTP